MAKKRKNERPTPRRVEPPEPRRALKRNGLLFGVLAVGGAIIAVAVVGLIRGGDDGNGTAIRDLLAPTDSGPVHVHGLGINPADKALVIATHTGIYRVPPNAQQAARVGDSRQDTMGFTVVGANRFLGSGHPDPRAMRESSLPPNLGLIESTDGGRTWTPISLLGEADFHVLRSRGRLVYGFDSTNARLLVSVDRGRTWSRRPIPGLLIDLAVHPDTPSTLVAATERGLIASLDRALTWQAVGPQRGLLAWPASSRLFLVDPGGAVHISSAGLGRRWTQISDIVGQPAAFVAESAQELYVALHDGTIKRSADGGRSWDVRSSP